ncbi:MAG: hypothetical protein H6668_22140 [Ardenticatenaceae bacterium]|nr:hypothetical protein [Ardenticatenaceae bacterium]
MEPSRFGAAQTAIPTSSTDLPAAADDPHHVGQTPAVLLAAWLAPANCARALHGTQPEAGSTGWAAIALANGAAKGFRDPKFYRLRWWPAPDCPALNRFYMPIVQRRDIAITALASRDARVVNPHSFCHGDAEMGTLPTRRQFANH